MFFSKLLKLLWDKDNYKQSKLASVKIIIAKLKMAKRCFQIPRAVKGSVQTLLDKKNERNNQEEICNVLDLNQVLTFVTFVNALVTIVWEG